MGCGATRTLERVAAALGGLSQAPLQFEAVQDVPQGGVLLALPALLANGLLSHTSSCFQLPPGFYGLDSIFLLLALLALARVKSLEQLRYCAPGEWGKLLGLDRVPEVRTLRQKLKLLCAPQGVAETGAQGAEGHLQRWGTQLAQDWLAANPESAGQFYVDGHVRVYHGEQTALPRHYVARQKLCLRATTDYWVNALDGQPFFLLTREVDPGLLAVLREQIVPRLETLLPAPPALAEQRRTPPQAPRFTLVFDREGYSPEFFLEMQQRQVAVLTYHKYPGTAWPEEEFEACTVKLANGEESSMRLAERRVEVGGKLWMREVRKLSAGGYQTALLSSNEILDLRALASAMFARWCQENFFRYMREHYNLDRLAEYGTEDIPGTTRLVNPRWRELDGQVRREVGKVQRQLTLFGALELDEELEPQKVKRYAARKGELQEEIARRQEQVAALKLARKETAQHVTVAELPEADRFQRLRSARKYFVDTIKMIAYRAETAMTSIVREKLAREEDARALLRDIYGTEVDLQPNPTTHTLTVRLHHLATRAHDETLRHLCTELNATETLFPRTDLHLVYELGSS